MNIESLNSFMYIIRQNAQDKTSMTEVPLSLVFGGRRLWVWETHYSVPGVVIFASHEHNLTVRTSNP